MLIFRCTASDGIINTVYKIILGFLNGERKPFVFLLTFVIEEILLYKYRVKLVRILRNYTAGIQ